MVTLVVVLLVGLFVVGPALWPEADGDEVPLSEVLADAQQGRVLRIDVDGKDLEVLYRDADGVSAGETRRSSMGENTDLEALLLALGVPIAGDTTPVARHWVRSFRTCSTSCHSH